LKIKREGKRRGKERKKTKKGPTRFLGEKKIGGKDLNKKKKSGGRKKNLVGPRKEKYKTIRKEEKENKKIK
jgi:hypothetical protein